MREGGRGGRVGGRGEGRMGKVWIHVKSGKLWNLHIGFLGLKSHRILVW